MILDFERFVEATTFGIHPVKVRNPKNNTELEVMAKFDTGARFSSICISVAEKLGFSEDTLYMADHSDPKNINSEISHTKKMKSANGVKDRIFVDLDIFHTDKYIKTQVSITDRSHMNFDMIIGLKDMDHVK